MHRIPIGTAAKSSKKSREKRILNKLKRKRTMKTYKTKECLGRLSAYLVATNKPFNFDGFLIEFTAGDAYMLRMRLDDPRLARVKFETI